MTRDARDCARSLRVTYAHAREAVPRGTPNVRSHMHARARAGDQGEETSR